MNCLIVECAALVWPGFVHILFQLWSRTPHFRHISVGCTHTRKVCLKWGWEPIGQKLRQQRARQFLAGWFSVQLSYVLNFPLFAIRENISFGVARETWIFVIKALRSGREHCKLQTASARRNSGAGRVWKAGIWIGLNTFTHFSYYYFFYFAVTVESETARTESWQGDYEGKSHRSDWSTCHRSMMPT